MADLVAELAAKAQSLAPDERSRLVGLLLESLHVPPLAEIKASRSEEIERRFAAYDRGEVETFATGDVFSEARRLAVRCWFPCWQQQR
jgi:putative addiction module component (TIGR02574 family)